LLPQYTHLLFTHVTPYSVIVSWKNIHVNIICKITHPTLITTKEKKNQPRKVGSSLITQRATNNS
ncbi:MAG: hypothetical protein ACOYCB_13380, partial [Fastidiosipilaceae bacterium]|jgi:hypothetical protein